jgi:2-polyprenyl-3-methyl-5-hydroxy-6-metoxy-1,4-benzoquinol methylase
MAVHGESREFVRHYEDKYRAGYLDGSWPAAKKLRLQHLIESLPLPKVGTALDVGCGDGEITQVLRAALPGWRVYGVEISSEAIAAARAHRPGCEFFTWDELPPVHGQVDLLFTHHVLEHVSSVAESLRAAEPLAKPGAAMLHVMPCGNPGSLEHSICVSVVGGMDPGRGNRFFFEDPTHLRRLTSAELATLAAAHAFTLKKESYGNQYAGALDWITQSPPKTVLALTDYRRGIDAQARRRLWRLRLKLMTLWMLRMPAAFTQQRWRRRHKRLADYPLLAVGVILYPFSKPVDWWITRAARREWEERRCERNGSEMFLYFERQPG